MNTKTCIAFLIAMLILPFFGSIVQVKATSYIEIFELTRGEDYICENVTYDILALGYYLNVMWWNDSNNITMGYGTFYPFIAIWLYPELTESKLAISGSFSMMSENGTSMVNGYFTYNATLYSNFSEAYDDGELIGVITYYYNTDEPFSWLSDFLGFFNGIWNTLWTIGQFLMSLAISLAPLLPLFILLMLVDVVMTSISTGSVTPIGNFTMRVWELAVSIVSAIIAVLEILNPF